MERSGVQSASRGWVLALSMLVAGPVSGVPQDREGQLDRAQERIDELFHFRINLIVEEVGRRVEITEEAIPGILEPLHAAADAFRAAHPAVLQHQGPISWDATPIQYEPFSKLLTSEGWRAAVDALDGEVRGALVAVVTERQERLDSALADLIQARVVRGLCLTEDERVDIAEACRRAATDQVEAGLVEPNTYYYQHDPKDMFFALMEDAGLEKALSGKRQELFRTMHRRNRRTVLDDHELEIEFLLRGQEAEQERRLLVGFAEAVARRDGGQVRTQVARFEPVKRLESDRDWNKALRGVLRLDDDEDLPEMPSRDDSSIAELRAVFFLAVLDERAYFSDEQREALLPLIRKVVKNYAPRSESSTGLQLPGWFKVSSDGLLIPGENRMNRPSTKVKALIDTFYENCTQDQRDVLES